MGRLGYVCFLLAVFFGCQTQEKRSKGIEISLDGSPPENPSNEEFRQQLEDVLSRFAAAKRPVEKLAIALEIDPYLSPNVIRALGRQEAVDKLSPAAQEQFPLARALIEKTAEQTKKYLLSLDSSRLKRYVKGTRWAHPPVVEYFLPVAFEGIVASEPQGLCPSYDAMVRTLGLSFLSRYWEDLVVGSIFYHDQRSRRFTVNFLKDLEKSGQCNYEECQLRKILLTSFLDSPADNLKSKIDHFEQEFAKKNRRKKKNVAKFIRKYTTMWPDCFGTVIRTVMTQRELEETLTRGQLQTLAAYLRAHGFEKATDKAEFWQRIPFKRDFPLLSHLDPLRKEILLEVTPSGYSLRSLGADQELRTADDVVEVIY